MFEVNKYLFVNSMIVVFDVLVMYGVVDDNGFCFFILSIYYVVLYSDIFFFYDLFWFWMDVYIVVLFFGIEKV